MTLLLTALALVSAVAAATPTKDKRPVAHRSDDSDVVELSPSTVNAVDGDVYQANYTLSGAPLKTENRYASAAITEISR